MTTKSRRLKQNVKVIDLHLGQTNDYMFIYIYIHSIAVLTDFFLFSFTMIWCVVVPALLKQCTDKHNYFLYSITKHLERAQDNSK